MKERLMYDGRYAVRFEDKGHKYRIKDEVTGRQWMPGSVTGRLGVINKPFLVQWAANLAAESGDKTAHRKVAQDAGRRGTKVHNAIEHYLTNDVGDEGDWLNTLPVGIRGYVRAFLDWEKGTNLATCEREAEYMVYSRRLDTIGTLDLLASIDDSGTPWVIDFKTSKRIYPTHMLQVSLYAAALMEEGIVTGANRGILRVAENGSYQFLGEDAIYETVGSILDCLDVVEGCVAIDKWQKAKKGRK